MNEHEFRKAIERLEERLDRIERALGPALAGAAKEPEAPLPPPVVRAAPPAAPPAPPPFVPRPAPPTAPPVAPVTPPPVVPARPRSPWPSVAPPPPVTFRPPPGAAPPTAPAPRRPAAPPIVRGPAARQPAAPRASLEMRIGQRWAAWVGATVTVLAVSFAVKLGYDQWWGHISPTGRFLLVAAFGTLLVGAGEVAFRRIGPAASVGLFGAGLGTLYLDAFAAFRWFQPPIVNREWSFVLMAAVAIGGFAITLRTRFLTIGVLSIVAGYLTPWLFWGGPAHVVQVGFYLTILLGISLALSWARARPFRAMRYVALGAHGITALGWVIAAARSDWEAAMVFCTAWWAAVVGECVLAAIRGQSRAGNAFATLLATAWFVTVGCFVLESAQPAGNWLGAFTLGVGIVAAAIAATIGPPLPELGKAPRGAAGWMAIALWSQAAVLLAVAVALQFQGFGQSVGWLAIGLGAIEIGRRIRLKAAEIFGLIVGALAIARVAILDWWQPALRVSLWNYGNAHLTYWAILALAAILATHLAAWRLQPAWRRMPVVLAALGAMEWMGATGYATSGFLTTGLWLAGAAVLLMASAPAARQRYLEISLLLLCATAALWLQHAAALRMSSSWQAAGFKPFLNWQMALAAAIVAVGWWASRVLARRAPRAAPQGIAWQIAVIAASAFMLVGMTFEADRTAVALSAGGLSLAAATGQARQLFITMVWGCGAAGLGVLAAALTPRGGKRPELIVGWAWAILAGCAAKWLLVDTLSWQVSARAALTESITVLNVQMLAGAVVAACMLLLHALVSPAGREGPRVASWMPIAATLLLLWGLSFEVERAVARYERTLPGGESIWDPTQLRVLWWTLLWGAGGLAMVLWTRLRFSGPMLLAGWCLTVLAASMWLVVNTLARVDGGVVLAPIVLNLQFATGAAAAAMAAIATWQAGRLRRAGDGAMALSDTRIALVIVGLVGLWLGSFEIDRYFAPEAGNLLQHAAMARQTGLSIWWGIYAIAALGLGFARRSAAVRYAGLALLILTLGKVMTVDMAEVRYVYRVLSLLGVGLLLVATSVGYAKLAPRIKSS